ncbi:glycosyltransferase family 4 protein [Candidatus Cloacimonadota bacterium]
MKILQIAPQILPVPPSLGGAVEDGIYQIASILAETDNVHVISRKGKIYGPANIKYLHLDFSLYERFLRDFFNSYRNQLAKLSRSCLKYTYSLKFKKIMDSDYNLIHVRNLAVAYPFIHKNKKNAKVILHLHNDIIKKYKLKRSFYRKLLNKYDLILYVSDYLRLRTLQFYPELNSRSLTLHNGVNLDLFRPLGIEINEQIRRKYGLTNERVILYAGRIIPEKGVLDIVAAFNEICTKTDKIKLFIAGSRAFKNSRDNNYVRSVKNSANSNVIFTGFIPHSELRNLYSIADIFIYPSVWDEPFGKAVLEAMAARTAVVASNSGGIPEIITEPDQGIIVPKNDPDSIVKAVNYLLSSKKILEQFKDSAYKRAQNFSWREVTKKLKIIYNDL